MEEYIKKVYSPGKTSPMSMLLKKDNQWYKIDLNEAYSGTLKPKKEMKFNITKGE